MVRYKNTPQWADCWSVDKI